MNEQTSATDPPSMRIGLELDHDYPTGALIPAEDVVAIDLPAEPPETILAALPLELRHKFRWEFDRATQAARDPAHRPLLARLLQLWGLKALDRGPQDDEHIERGRAELRSALRIIIGVRCGAMLCGHPTSAKGKHRGRPCQQFRAVWPSDRTLELWACLAHLSDEDKAIWQACDTLSRTPLPPAWQGRVRRRTFGDPLAPAL